MATRSSTPQRAAGAAKPSNGEVPKRRRMSAPERRHSILEAARKAFSETGDVNGTTIKVIAEKSGISEGVIYRHFESKEQLFFEAIVEPLEEAVLAMVQGTIDMGTLPYSEERRVAGTEQMYKRLSRTLGKAMPLLGLVLFGDPETARTFYRTTFTKAVNDLAAGWEKFFADYGVEVPAATIARAVMGISLMMALESRFNPRFDTAGESVLLADLTLNGFFPQPESYGLVRG